MPDRVRAFVAHPSGNENVGNMGVPILAEDRVAARRRRGRVKALVEEGRCYDEVVAADPTPEFTAKWGDPGRFLTATYAELGGED